MVRLLDYIFEDIDRIKEDRSLVLAYLNYLNEILNQGLPPEKEVQYAGLKTLLEKRLAELDLDKGKNNLR